jgi:glycosyltransferase involved in cell wall biosynthesis
MTNRLNSEKVTMSVIIPTRERADYLYHCLKACLANPGADIEFVVLDNASKDNTKELVEAFDDKRIRYEPSEQRLSMRDNFERGLAIASGKYLCFIGDDDALFPFSIERAVALFDQFNVDAVSTQRAHYSWPDLLSSRRNTALLPRHSRVSKLNSRDQIRSLLTHDDYYSLPCVYHGFVRKSVIDNITKRTGRFFHSSQVDIYSSIALSMENIDFVYSLTPLVINGGSSRSNGASHFGGGGSEEKLNWKKEDDLGFLDGFEDYMTVGSLIIESALRYSHSSGNLPISDIFDELSIKQALQNEYAARTSAARPTAGFLSVLNAYGLGVNFRISSTVRPQSNLDRWKRLFKSAQKFCPIDMGRYGIGNVEQAAKYMDARLTRHQIGLFASPINQMSAALKIALPPRSRKLSTISRKT